MVFSIEELIVDLTTDKLTTDELTVDELTVDKLTCYRPFFNCKKHKEKEMELSFSSSLQFLFIFGSLQGHYFLAIETERGR